MPRADLRDPEATYNKLNAQQLLELSPQIEWSYYLSALFVAPSFADQPKGSLENVNVIVPTYFG